MGNLVGSGPGERVGVSPICYPKRTAFRPPRDAVRAARLGTVVAELALIEKFHSALSPLLFHPTESIWVVGATDLVNAAERALLLRRA